MNCVFQLNAYQIETVAVARNENFDRKLDAHTGDIAASIAIVPHSKDSGKYRLTLEIQVKPTAQKEKEFFPYLIAIRGRAYFTFKDPCPPADAEHALRLNGASILYGLLRAQVAQITAQAVYGQFLLPAMNFVELAKTQTPVDGDGPAAVGEKPAPESLYGGTASTPSAQCVREKPAAYRKAPKPARTAKRKGA